jgi:hypothetical protein
MTRYYLRQMLKPLDLVLKTMKRSRGVVRAEVIERYGEMDNGLQF